MCGIYGVVGTGPDAADLVLKGLKRLEYRGYDSWGLVALGDQGQVTTRRVGLVSQDAHPSSAAHIALGHTRWATHGGVTEENAHPHTDCRGALSLVHNGIVENADVLKSRLVASGHRFLSATDSEVIVHLVEEAVPAAPSLHHAVLQAFRELEGVNGIAVLHASTGEMVAATSGAPLVVGLGKDGTHLASDPSAFAPHVERLVFLHDGQLAVLQPTGIWVMDIALGAWVHPQVSSRDDVGTEIDLGPNEHWMWREIAEQPRLLRLVAGEAASESALLAKKMRDATSVTWVGCGSAYHAALFARYRFAQMGERSHAVPGSEFPYLADAVSAGGLLIALSQSGETIDVLDAVKIARARGSETVALVNSSWSTLARQANAVVRLRAGPERCVLATKSFLAKLAVITLAAAALKDDQASGQAMLRSAADAIDRLLDDQQDDIRELAARLSSHEHMFCLGRGECTALALEAALKIKEGSYLHAEGFSAGELKHGVIALIEPGTPCLFFVPDDATRPAVVSAISEVRARGGFTIALASTAVSVADVTLQISGEAGAWPLVAVAASQLLAYHIALNRGHNPDRPRNLAKSVTVR